MSRDFLSVDEPSKPCPLCNRKFKEGQAIRVVLETTVHITHLGSEGRFIGADLNWHGEEWVHEECYCNMLPTTIEELMR